MRSRSLILFAFVALAAAAAAHARPTRGTYLALADRGIAAAHDVWWNPKKRWYDDKRDVQWSHGMPLATLWSAFPLFEAVDAVALADPTAAHVAAVNTFAANARRYWNPAMRCYSFYPGMRRGGVDVYFDDNGWWGIAFTDAYTATGDRAYLADAARALDCIVRDGWDERDYGGTWWDSRHHHKTIEPLAAAALVAARLYTATGDRSRLLLAQQYAAWADTNSRDGSSGLYTRSDTDTTLMPYAQGLMIGVDLELCRATHAQTWCRRAEAVADAAVTVFGTQFAQPHNNAIYLRFLLDLYREDGNRRWYDVVEANAARALAHAGGPDGLYLKDWSGKPLGRPLLRTHAATVSVFAWLAAAPPPVQ